ncbi:glucose 1-dehydrogenase [Pseudonocardia sp. RS010]|uniref:glucose 1-dehydrogenase n=1 Tax=Pseudonocardia sp. RS010 TaxID=3385979 RepID=UPI0039A32D2D
MNMTKQLENKVAVVTGAGSGIGAAIAAALHAAGAKVVVSDISGAQEETAKGLGDGAVAVHADVSQGADVQQLLDAAVSNFGTLDIICNNAGIDGELGPLGECSEENYDRIMGINARGVFLGMRYGIPKLIEHGGGSIINTASIAANVAFPTMPAYCASKGAIVSMTRTAAAEYGAAGVRINAICPGVTATALVDRLPQEMIAGATAVTPMQRVGTAEEMAGAVVYLASDAASFVTGAFLSIDGGYTTL